MPDPLPTIDIDASLDMSGIVPSVRHFARAIAHIVGAVGVTDGTLAWASGSHTVMFVFTPKTKEDASKVIGRRGAIANAIRALAEATGNSCGMGFVFKVDSKKVEEDE